MWGVDEDMERSQVQDNEGEEGQAMLGIFHDDDIFSALAKGQMAWAIGNIFQIGLKSSLFTSSLFPWKDSKW